MKTKASTKPNTSTTGTPEQPRRRQRYGGTHVITFVLGLATGIFVCATNRALDTYSHALFAADEANSTWAYDIHNHTTHNHTVPTQGVAVAVGGLRTSNHTTTTPTEGVVAATTAVDPERAAVSDHDYDRCRTGSMHNRTHNGTNTTVQQQQPKLTFVHIPKTGGSTIEEAAKEQANIRWGYQQWTPWKTKQTCCLWHMPPSVIPSLGLESKQPKQNPSRSLPYDDDGDNDENHNSTNDLFAVIRNPFARVVSEVFYKCGLKSGKKAQQSCLSNKKAVNHRIRQNLNEKLNCNSTLAACYLKESHWIPQWHFFYDPHTGDRTIRYLLHFENLAGDLAALFEATGVNISLDRQKRARATKYKNATELDSNEFAGLKDLDNKTIRLIVEVFRRDFEIGGYSLDVHEASLYGVSNASQTMNTGRSNASFWELPCHLDINTTGANLTRTR